MTSNCFDQATSNNAQEFTLPPPPPQVHPKNISLCSILFDILRKIVPCISTHNDETTVTMAEHVPASNRSPTVKTGITPFPGILNAVPAVQEKASAYVAAEALKTGTPEDKILGLVKIEAEQPGHDAMDGLSPSPVAATEDAHFGEVDTAHIGSPGLSEAFDVAPSIEQKANATALCDGNPTEILPVLDASTLVNEDPIPFFISDPSLEVLASLPVDPPNAVCMPLTSSSELVFEPPAFSTVSKSPVLLASSTIPTEVCAVPENNRYEGNVNRVSVIRIRSLDTNPAMDEASVTKFKQEQGKLTDDRTVIHRVKKIYRYMRILKENASTPRQKELANIFLKMGNTYVTDTKRDYPHLFPIYVELPKNMTGMVTWPADPLPDSSNPGHRPKIQVKVGSGAGLGKSTIRWEETRPFYNGTCPETTDIADCITSQQVIFEPTRISQQRDSTEPFLIKANPVSSTTCSNRNDPADPFCTYHESFYPNQELSTVNVTSNYKLAGKAQRREMNIYDLSVYYPQEIRPLDIRKDMPELDTGAPATSSTLNIGQKRRPINVIQFRRRRPLANPFTVATRIIPKDKQKLHRWFTEQYAVTLLNELDLKHQRKLPRHNSAPTFGELPRQNLDKGRLERRITIAGNIPAPDPFLQPLASAHALSSAGTSTFLSLSPTVPTRSTFPSIRSHRPDHELLPLSPLASTSRVNLRKLSHTGHSTSSSTRKFVSSPSASELASTPRKPLCAKRLQGQPVLDFVLPQTKQPDEVSSSCRPSKLTHKRLVLPLEVAFRESQLAESASQRSV